MQDFKKKEEFNWYAAKLSLIILAVFALQNIFPFYTDNFALISSTFFQQPWSVLTYIFLHANLNHVFSNLFSLVLFGLILEKIVGSRNFLLVFFSSGIFAGIVSLFFYPSVIGASGAIFGIMGVLAVIRPKMVVFAFGIPIPMIVAVIIWAALDLGGVFYPSSIANIGHLAGLGAGIVVGFLIRPRYKVAEKKKEKIKLDEEYFREWEKKYMKH
ncbi:MAG: rhomboid family intramembrane serine protease [Candidatus Aenigmarchaeota archaeon]|nr:rhomboid family intramembrane serine protease [Candidatus Aenigmarchaeota archaeon]